MIILLMLSYTLGATCTGIGIRWLWESIKDKDFAMRVLGLISIFIGMFILSLSTFVAFLGSPS